MLRAGTADRSLAMIPMATRTRCEGACEGSAAMLPYLLTWCIFFFSSRRRHTRFDCDWSSDVCSSDLPIQLFGHDPEVMREAAAIAAEHGADMIDINMGCPVRKVVKTGAGASLLDEPDRAVALARAAHEGSGLPVTVKLRSGQRPGELTGIELARRLAADAGVAAISLHPRHASQQHSGEADHPLAADPAAGLDVPVMPSGG